MAAQRIPPLNKFASLELRSLLAYTFFLFFLLLSVGCVAQQQANAADNATMYALRGAISPYLGFAYPSPTSSVTVDFVASWNSGGPCTWAGISCAPGGQVVSIYLDAGVNNGTTAQLGLSFPPQLFLLSSLTSIYWANSQVAGAFSPGFAAMSNLTAIGFFNLPSLSGTLPQSLASNLQSLQLSGGNLTGTWPASLAGLTQLSTFVFRIP